MLFIITCQLINYLRRPQNLSGELTKPVIREKIVNSTIEKFGQINILVNNAEIVNNGTFETGSLTDYDSVMDMNVRSLVALTQLCIPHLRKTKGNIVNVSSVNGIRLLSPLPSERKKQSIEGTRRERLKSALYLRHKKRKTFFWKKT